MAKNIDDESDEEDWEKLSDGDIVFSTTVSEEEEEQEWVTEKTQCVESSPIVEETESPLLEVVSCQESYDGVTSSSESDTDSEEPTVHDYESSNYYQQVLKSPSVAAEEQDYITRLCQSVPLIKCRPKLINLAEQFSESEIIFIDGDALLVSGLMNESINWNFGGQMLHFIYIVERQLNVLALKGGKFEVMFFKESEKVLWHSSPSILLARKVLMLHLQSNMSIKVIEHFFNVWDDEFAEYVRNNHPVFMLTNDEGLEGMEIKNLIKEEQMTLSQYYFQWQINKLLGLQLNVALLEGMMLDVSSLKGFFIETNPQLYLIYRKNEKNIKEKYQATITKFKISDENEVKSQCPLQFPDLSIELNSLYMFITQLKEGSRDFAIYRDFGKVLLLYFLIKQELPLKKRSFPLLSFDMEIMKKLFCKIQSCLYDSLCACDDLDVVHVADIWDGNMLATICSLVASDETNLSIKQLLSAEMFKRYKQVFDQLYGSGKDDDCIQVSLQLKKLFCHLVERKKKEARERKPIIPEIIPVESELQKRYAGDVFETINVLPVESPRIQELLPQSKKFEDKYHWHCKVLISTDIFEVGKKLRSFNEDSLVDESLNEYEKRKKRRAKQRREDRLPRFIQVYGESIGVKTQKIVLEQCGGNVKKISAKAQSIQEENIKRKSQKDDERDRAKLKEAQEKFRHTKESSVEEEKYQKLLDYLNIIVKDVKNLSIKKKIHMIKILCLKQIIVKESKDESKIVSLFLLLRELWIEMQDQLTSDDKTDLAAILKELKFLKLSSIVQPNNALNEKGGRCHLEFQMEHMGHLLLRDVRKDPDERIDPKSYIPDTWQRELLDSVDSNRSALIVAPTSSGKTFASYYCMEKILKQNNEDVVVYVSPTKALCNQVMASIYNRYDKNMPAGKTVCGVFTRDFRTNVSNCQILVTVPQCLEILLLSKDGYDWARRIKYVIFDEIHCIGAMEMGGEVWEHLLLLISCPFLALSATVENPEELHMWLQKAQDYQRNHKGKISNHRTDEEYKVDLIIVKDRHSHLKKHVHTSSGIQPIHPFTVLAAWKVKNNGIPEHISLAPEECLKLFRVMEKIWADNKDLLSLSPEQFFDKNLLFMKVSDVKQYESALKEEFSKWAHNNENLFNKCCYHLRPSIARKIIEKRETHFVQLLNELKAKDMLPVIVFCLDRWKCEKLVHEVYRYCKKVEKSCKSEKMGGISKSQQKKLNKKLEKIKEHRKNSDERWGEEVNDSLLANCQKETSMLWLAEQKSDASFRAVGVQDSQDLKYLYNRHQDELKTLFMHAIRYGISFHHSGMNNRKRSTVEILFRRKFIRVVVATSTLALGIHAPCRTVVLYDDSPYLTPIMYRQMSGRAGRRGYDLAGNVIFQNIPRTKVCSLMSGSLPRLLGNFPVSTTLYLRLFIMIDGVTDRGKPSETAREDTIIRSTSLLKHPLILQQFPELHVQFQHLFLFSTQFLLREGFLNQKGQPQGLAGIAAHLHYLEPGNYAFISALTAGLFHKLCRKKDVKVNDGKYSERFLRQLVTILSHYFTKLPVHPLHKEACELNNSLVTLPSLPKEFQEDIGKYNDRVGAVFDMYLVSVASLGDEAKDNVLPLSKVSFEPSVGFRSPEYGTVEYYLDELSQDNKICSSFVGLSSHTDNHMYNPEELISNARQGVFTDIKVIPTMKYRDDLNSYALDFFKHGIDTAIISENNLKSGEAYQKLYDFSLVLLAIAVPLEEFSPAGDPVAAAFRQLADEYANRFRKTFHSNSY